MAFNPKGLKAGRSEGLEANSQPFFFFQQFSPSSSSIQQFSVFFFFISPTQPTQVNSYPTFKTATISSYMYSHSGIETSSVGMLRKNPLPTSSYQKTITNASLGFSLYDNGQYMIADPEQQKALMDFIPGCTKLTFSPPYLIVYCQTLPPKPWPCTLADLSLIVTDDENAKGIDIGRNCFGPKIHLDAEITRGSTPSQQAFVKIFQAFRDLHAEINRLQWIGWAFLAFGPGELTKALRSRLPFTINNCFVGYVFGKNEPFVELTMRTKLPTDRSADNDSYQPDLRPGVMIASKGSHSQQLFSTSGICVATPLGGKHITVASHGFHCIGDEVYHPDVTGTVIGTVEHQMSDSDVSLVKLHPNLQYSRETFSAVNYKAQPFRQLGDAHKVKVGDTLHMNTPFNGHCMGICVRIDVMKIPVDEPVNSWEYVTSLFGYCGNGAEELFVGCCGGVIWTDEFDVVGQFRFAVKGSDECYGTTFTTFAKQGWSLSEM